MIKHWYAVRKGHQSNVVVTSWAECEQLVKGFKGAIFKGFPLYQKNQAYQFAENGKYKNQPPKKKAAKKEDYSTPQWKCVLRKSYRDPFTGVYYKNRCVVRKGPTIRGENFKPHIGSSCPF